jgi:TATA-box binding protein (TBP) (component of TFIID and TFIIIB)
MVKESGDPTFVIFKPDSAICLGNRSVQECKTSTERLYNKLISAFERDVDGVSEF